MSKPPREWDEEYILSSLPVGEHTWIEGKGSRLLDVGSPGVDRSKGLDTLSKAISAMANSGGGILVLGMNEHKTGWEIDDGGMDLSFEGKGRITTREWLGNVIPNLVDGPLNDFDVYVITRGTGDSKIGEEQGVFLIEIGDSDKAPHQAAHNKVYYGRSGSNSVPLAHRFVTDIFNRRRHPKLELSVKFHIVTERKLSEEEVLAALTSDWPIRPGHERNEYETREVLEARFQVRNAGKVLVDYMHCRVWIPTGIVSPDFFRKDQVEQIDNVDYVVWTADNIERDLIKDSAAEIGQAEYGPSWYKRILPGMTRSWEWGGGAFKVEMVNAYSYNHFLWEILADNAPVEKGTIKIGDIKQVFERGVRHR